MNEDQFSAMLTLIVPPIIEQIAKNDVVIFIITHDYEFLCQVSDEVLYFDKQGIKERIEVNENNKNKILEMMS